MTSRLKNRAQSLAVGQVAINTTATQLPAATARRFQVQMLLDATGNFDARIAVGGSTVTLATGWVLRPTDKFPWVIEVLNLNLLYAIASIEGQSLNYFGEQ